MTFAEFIANPMAPVAIVALIVFVGFCVIGLCQTNEPTPEYVRLMSEHNARQAEWEAGRPARAEAYKLAYEARLQARREADAEQRAAIRANLAKGV